MESEAFTPIVTNSDLGGYPGEGAAGEICLAGSPRAGSYIWMSPRLATTRLVKVRGERRWTTVPAYAERPSGAEELAGLFHRAKHEIAQSADPALESWARYRAASRAAAVLSTLVLRASGYETVPPGDPKGAFDALPTLFGAEGRAPATAFLVGHRKSRRKTSPWGPAALERELRKISREVHQFRKSVLEWLESTRRTIFPPVPKTTRDKTEPHQGRLF